VVHAMGASKDLRSGWLLTLTMATVFAVVAAIVYRVLDALAAVPRPARVPEQLVWADEIQAAKIRAHKTGSIR